MSRRVIPTSSSNIPALQRQTANTVNNLIRSAANAGVVSVKDYGAKGDGTTDDTTAILACLAYLNTLGGGTATFPPGTYVVNSSGNFAYAYGNIWLSAETLGPVVLVNGSSNSPLLTWGDGITQLYGGGIRNISFSGKSGVTGVLNQMGPIIKKVGQFRIENVRVNNYPSALYDGIKFSSCSQFHIDHLEVQGCTRTGVIAQLCTDIYWSNSRCDANGDHGYYFDGCQGMWLSNASAYYNDDSAYVFNSTNPSSAPNMNNFFVNCVGDTSGSYNWQINDSINSSWVQCWGSTQKSAAVNTFASGFFLYGEYCRNLIFTNCHAEYNNADGFQVYDPGSSSPTYIQIIGGSFGTQGYAGSNGNGQGGTGYGVDINGAADHIRIVGGQMLNNATGAINNTSSGSDIIISGNPMGFVTSNQGTGSVAVAANTATVTHGLGFTPAAKNITLTDTSSRVASGINSAWVSAVSSTTFTVTTDVNVATTAFNFAWAARYSGA